MKKESRTELLARMEQEVDRQLEVVVNKFQTLSESALLKQSQTGGWSIAQNLKHLNLYFDYYLPAIDQALENASEDSHAIEFKSTWLGSYFTKSMDYRGKGKVKAFKDYIPSPELDANGVLQEFIENQEALLLQIRKASNYNLTKIKLAISLTKLIKMRLGDVLQFVIMHNERHIVQAESRME